MADLDYEKILGQKVNQLNSTEEDGRSVAGNTSMPSLGDFDVASVSDEINGLLSEGSPYLDAAQADAMQTANSRGLLNSSIAVSAGTDAAIEGAFDIASQDAAAKNEIVFNTQEHGYDLETLAAEQGYTLEQMAEEHGYDLETLAAEQGYTLEQMTEEHGYTMDQLETEQEYILEQMASENEITVAQIDQKYGWETMLSAMGLDAEIAETTSNNVTDLNQQFMVEWGDIMDNPDLDSETKEEWIADLTDGFITDLGLVFDTAGIDFEVLDDGEFVVGDSDRYQEIAIQV